MCDIADNFSSNMCDITDNSPPGTSREHAEPDPAASLSENVHGTVWGENGTSGGGN